MVPSPTHQSVMRMSQDSPLPSVSRMQPESPTTPGGLQSAKLVLIHGPKSPIVASAHGRAAHSVSVGEGESHDPASVLYPTSSSLLKSPWVVLRAMHTRGLIWSQVGVAPGGLVNSTVSHSQTWVSTLVRRQIAPEPHGSGSHGFGRPQTPGVPTTWKPSGQPQVSSSLQIASACAHSSGVAAVRRYAKPPPPPDCQNEKTTSYFRLESVSQRQTSSPTIEGGLLPVMSMKSSKSNATAVAHADGAHCVPTGDCPPFVAIWTGERAPLNRPRALPRVMQTSGVMQS